MVDFVGLPSSGPAGRVVVGALWFTTRRVANMSVQKEDLFIIMKSSDTPEGKNGRYPTESTISASTKNATNNSAMVPDLSPRAKNAALTQASLPLE